ncbi:MAG TPA: BACON domain-containing carbohydrate-binding protein, partial [Candidatus Acidoferrum sp.]|nr:BACON domain-containing carbohydrate-binding protein [Candidatus Acidoferrum sp.]
MVGQWGFNSGAADFTVQQVIQLPADAYYSTFQLQVSAWGNAPSAPPAVSFSADATLHLQINVVTGLCASCSIWPASATYSNDAGSGIISVSTAASDCVWGTSCDADWVSIISGVTNTGPGTVSYTVAPNCATNARTATVSVNDQQFTITQAGLRLNTSLDVYPASGGFGYNYVSAPSNCQWTAASGTAWIVITNGATGDGPGFVMFSIGANNGCCPRTNTMTLAGLPYTVIQEGGPNFYTIAPTNAAFDAGGGNGSIGVTAFSQYCQWFAIPEGTEDAGWITFPSTATGTGNGNVSYAVALNDSSISRTGAVLVAGHTFTVIQAGGTCGFTFDTPYVACGFGSNYGTVQVQAGYDDCDWIAWSTAGWITITNGASGTGSEALEFVVAPNSNGVPRTGSLIVSDPALLNQAAMTLYQDGISACTYTVSPMNASFGAGTNSGIVSVATASNCAWTAAANATWLAIVPGSRGLGADTVSYTVAANPTTNWRSGTLTVAGRTVTVNQAGASNCTCTISTSASPSAGGSTSGDGAVGCNSNITVRATANPNYVFLNWMEAGASVSASAYYTFKPSSNRSLVAVFATWPSIIATNPLPPGATGMAYSQALQAANGTPPYTWSVISNGLPPGLSLNPGSGLIGGMPSLPTNAVFTVMVTDVHQLTATQAFNLAISMGPLHVAPATLPAAMQNAPYNAPLQALGGQPPYAWSLEPGS